MHYVEKKLGQYGWLFLVILLICGGFINREVYGQQPLNTNVLKRTGNIIQNGSAEEINNRTKTIDYMKGLTSEKVINAPLHWSVYLGQGHVEWGTTKKETYSGDRSAFLTMKQKGKEGLIVGGLLQGVDGQWNTGGGIYKAVLGIKYHISFWIKADIESELKVIIWGYKDCQEGEDPRQWINTSLGKEIVVTKNWKEYHGTFTLLPDTKTFAVLFSATIKKEDKYPLTYYIDDVQVVAEE